MSERADRDSLSDIQESICRIHDYTVSMTYEAFLADIKTQDAVIRNLEIVGEATKNHGGCCYFPGVDYPGQASCTTRCTRRPEEHEWGRLDTYVASRDQDVAGSRHVTKSGKENSYGY